MPQLDEIILCKAGGYWIFLVLLNVDDMLSVFCFAVQPFSLCLEVTFMMSDACEDHIWKKKISLDLQNRNKRNKELFGDLITSR